jgi:hypothetical protein
MPKFRSFAELGRRPHLSGDAAPRHFVAPLVVVPVA